MKFCLFAFAFAASAAQAFITQVAESIPAVEIPIPAANKIANFTPSYKDGDDTVAYTYNTAGYTVNNTGGDIIYSVEANITLPAVSYTNGGQFLAYVLSIDGSWNCPDSMLTAGVKINKNNSAETATDYYFFVSWKGMFSDRVEGMEVLAGDEISVKVIAYSFTSGKVEFYNKRTQGFWPVWLEAMSPPLCLKEVSWDIGRDLEKAIPKDFKGVQWTGMKWGTRDGNVYDARKGPGDHIIMQMGGLVECEWLEDMPSGDVLYCGT
ncbi:hypothetical protein QBC41DRAFT_42360 [Cercophora samala]|uniref:Uncharacterized protein n=1 Tax=Cercophora samala TaxID=330535 RepID=A0AA40DCW5_9PEZI|nr:hypothetical protein QBC41DRAFT_42360 [Cercophora samala]